MSPDEDGAPIRAPALTPIKARQLLTSDVDGQNALGYLRGNFGQG